MAEAVAQTRKGLEVLSTLPDGLWRRQQELDLQLALGQALMTTKGFSATEAVETLARAQALAVQLDRPEHLVPLLSGQWTVHLARAEHRLAVSLGKQIEGIGDVRNEVAIQVFGRLIQGISRLYLSELAAARALLEEHSDPLHHQPAVRLESRFHALCTASAGITLAHLGYVDQARSRIEEALSQARQIKSAPTLAQVLLYANALDYYTGSPLTHAEEMLALSTEQAFPQWLAWALAFRGLSLTGPEQAEEALALLTQALAQLRPIGAILALPVMLAWIANVAAILGRSAEAWHCLAEAAQMVEATDERVYEVEVLYRVPGDLLSAAGNQFEAEQQYRQAIAAAERQSAKLFQLRACISLARLWRDQGRRREACDLLAPIYSWFTEGFDAPVLKEAKELLDELA